MRQSSAIRTILRMLGRFVSRLSSAPFVLRTLVVGMLAMVISGIAHAVAQPARDNTDASTLVESIVAGQATLDQVPTQFVDDLGYTPVAGSGTLRNPHGGCSTPVEVGPDRFAGACQTHDLGYDILRYAEMNGTRLEAKARFELDWRLYVDLLHSCETLTCSLKATTYYCAVSANSIRQGYKAPHAEPSTPWMVLVVGVIGLSAVGGLPVTRARLDNFNPEHVDTSTKHRRPLRDLPLQLRRLRPGHRVEWSFMRSGRLLANRNRTTRVE